MAVGCVDVSVDLLLRSLLEGIEPIELLSDCEHEPEGERREREHAQDADEREKAELADPAPGPARNRRLGAFSAKQHGSRLIVPPSGPRSER